MNHKLLKIQNSRKAMTLVELLIVLAIIALLGGIGVAVGYKLIAAGDTEKTKARLAIINNAVNDYFDQTDGYPGSIDTDDGPGEVFELRIRRETGGAVLPSYTRFVEKLKDLDAKAFDKDNPTEEDENDSDFTRFHFIDPSGRVIQFFPNGGLGSRPVLIAPGKDGVINTDDDIRSDK